MFAQFSLSLFACALLQRAGVHGLEDVLPVHRNREHEEHEEHVLVCEVDGACSSVRQRELWTHLHAMQSSVKRR